MTTEKIDKDKAPSLADRRMTTLQAFTDLSVRAGTQLWVPRSTRSRLKDARTEAEEVRREFIDAEVAKQLAAEPDADPVAVHVDVVGRELVREYDAVDTALQARRSGVAGHIAKAYSSRRPASGN